MKPDYLSYQRATAISFLGAILQGLMGLALLLYAIYAKDHAALTASWVVLLGLPVWITLAILFDQHRRERIETLEAESFAASDQAGSSVFEEGAADLKVAARRLAFMHRILVPTVSLVVGAALIGLGLWRFRSGWSLVDPDRFTKPGLQGLAIAVGLGVGVVGFIFARYVSGMAKQPVWGNLRAGSACAVGTALMGLALAVARFVDIAGADAGLRVLQAIVPAGMVLLGAEIFVNFLLDLYRPRKPGELPRPAFESRLLGFVAAPDRIAESISEAINYQFGLDVSSSWFYQLLSRSIALLVALGLAVVWLMSAVAVVEPHQRALILRFGAVQREVGPGLHFKWPWPVETAEVPVFIAEAPGGEGPARVTRTATGVRVLNIAKAPPTGDGPILWTNEHSSEENPTVVQASLQGDAGERDLALMAVEVPMHYAVRDVEAYERLGPPALRDELLRAVAQREAMLYFGSLTVDRLLGPERPAISAELRRRVESAFAALNPDASGTPRGAGVEVLFLAVEGVHPPRDAAPAFERVIAAQLTREKRLADAHAESTRALAEVVGTVAMAAQIVRELEELSRLERSAGSGAGRAGEPSQAVVQQRLKIRELIQTAGGRAATEILAASAQRWERHMGERGRAARYEGRLTAYTAAPSLYKAGLYFDTLREAIKDTRLYITRDLDGLHMRIDLTDKDLGTDVFRPEGSDVGQ